MASLQYTKMASVEKLELTKPSLEDVSKVLQEGLEKNFAQVEVKVVDCPDLSAPPFYLAAAGLCGSQKVVDVGGVPNLVPIAQKDKVFKVNEVATLVGTKEGLVVGAGAGPWQFVGVNSEMMTNMTVGENQKIETRVAKVDVESGEGELLQIDKDDFALMANLYMSDGKPGKVLQVKASKRTGEENYMSCIRKTLAAHYGDQPVALGGTFLVEKGKAKLHIMPEFSSCPLKSDEEVNQWLKFYEYDAPLVAVGYLVSHDPGFDLRIEHFHCFSDHGVGGHYHYDTTPDSVEYRGYFGIAETLYRIERATAKDL